MLRITLTEFVMWTIIMILLGGTLWDLLWTIILPDARATAHFARATWKQRIAWVGIIALAIFAVIGWIY